MTLGKRLLEALQQSPYWTEKTKSNGTTIQNLTCPACGDRTAWAYVNGPMAINCNRLSQCGSRTKTMDLFPEIRRNIEHDFPATKADPQRPAREYLLSRGLSEATVEGLQFRYFKNVRNSGSGAVMFPVGTDGKDKEVMNGRLFNPLAGDGKTHNIGSTSGRFWQHPGLAYDPSQPTWITEGIINALSLIEIGHQAIAVLAAGQDPAKVDLSAFPKKILAFDPDEAGRRACRKWKTAYPDAEVILCDQGQDWNDLLQLGTPDEVRKHFTTNRSQYRTNGELALATTADQYADIFYQFHKYLPGLFAFNGCTYFSILKTARGGDAPPY